MAAPQQNTEELEGISQDLRFAIYEDNLTEFQTIIDKYPVFMKGFFIGLDDSILIEAIGSRRVNFVHWMLENGFDSNPSPIDTPPLEFSFDKGDRSLVDILLSHGADPNFGRPMIAALNVKDEDLALDFAKKLIAHGCKINTIYDLYGDEANGFTALDFASKRPVLADYLRSQGGLTVKDVRAGKVSTSPSVSSPNLEQLDEDLLWTFNDNDLGDLIRLCTAYPELKRDSFPVRGGSVLEYAVGSERTEMIKWMLDNGFTANPEECDSTPLEEAIRKGNLSICELLLRHGADVNIARPMITALNRKDDLVALEFASKLMQHGCNINKIYDLYGDIERGFTALDFASERPKLAEYIRSNGGLSAVEVRAGKVSSSKVTTESNQRGDAIVHPNDEVIAYFEKAIGPASKKSLIQIVPTGIPIAIHTIAPAGNRKHMTLFTNGLSTKPMNVPEGGEDYRYAEIYIDLPGDWKIREVKDMQWAWPLHWLRKMAQYPHNGDTWLGAPVTLIADEEPPKPLYKGCPFSALFLFADSSFKRSDGNTVQLYRMIPLYASERAYEIKQGLKKFMQAMDKHEVPTIVDMNRKPFA